MISNIINLQKKYDTDKMANAISTFPSQIAEMLQKLENIELNNSYSNLNQILILGMGGSAIGAELCQTLILEDCNTPIIINRNYNIPNWVDNKTLVIVSSYSGNTEETLEGFIECLNRKAKCIIISTGGQISKLSLKNELDTLKLPPGYQPRAALGYSFMAIIFILYKTNFISYSIINKIKLSVSGIMDYSSVLKSLIMDNPALEFAKKIQNTVPIIYGSDGKTSIVASRLKSQLEENAKMLAFYNCIPEMNHNEIEGWNGKNKLTQVYSIIWIIDEDDHPQVLRRIEISKKLLVKHCKKQLMISVDGSDCTIRILKLIHFVDWVSYFVALLNGVNPTPVHRIQTLKKNLKDCQ